MTRPTPTPFVPLPPVVGLDPLVAVWPAGTVVYRSYNVAWGLRSFYAGDAGHRGRFHPFNPGRRRKPLPVLYASESVAGALAESIFHDVPPRGTRVVDAGKLAHQLCVPMTARRDLILADLTGAGLARIGVTRGELIDGGPRTYPATARWAKALHDQTDVDGLLWVSRLHDLSRNVVLFEDRVDPADLGPATGHALLALGSGLGFDLALELADQMGITITGIA